MAPICHAFVVTFFMFLDFEQIEHLKCSTVSQAGAGAPLVWDCGDPPRSVHDWAWEDFAAGHGGAFGFPPHLICS